METWSAKFGAMVRHCCDACSQELIGESEKCPSCSYGQGNSGLCEKCAFFGECGVCEERVCFLCVENPCDGCGKVICGSGTLWGEKAPHACVWKHPKSSCGLVVEKADDGRRENAEEKGMKEKEAVEEMAEKEREVAAEKQKEEDKKLEEPDVQLVKELLAGEKLKSPSFKAALSAWLHNRAGAKGGLGFKRVRG